MKVYACRWPNGDISFVCARTRLEAETLLDEVGDPTCEGIQFLPLHKCAIHLKLTDRGKFEYEDLDEATYIRIMERCYPALFALDDLADTEQTRRAVERERLRLDVQPTP